MVSVGYEFGKKISQIVLAQDIIWFLLECGQGQQSSEGLNGAGESCPRCFIQSCWQEASVLAWLSIGSLSFFGTWTSSWVI